MSDRTSLGRIAMRSALQLRRVRSIPREAPVNVYDLASALGVEVRFVDHKSLEGMFYREPHPKILLPSWEHRPKGRIAFSCAHELGHFQLGHGTSVDEYLEDAVRTGPRTDEEFAADTFASSLLMPRQAVIGRFSSRGWELSTATPQQLFIVAGELDVGYTTLLKHMCYGLDLIRNDWMVSRQKVSPKQIRQEVTGMSDPPRTLIVDSFWPDVPIDLEVGDLVVFSAGSPVDDRQILREFGSSANDSHWVAARAGETDIHIANRKHRVRVARTNYCGLLKYRFLDDPDDV